MIEVIDNFAPQDYFELIQNHVLSWNQNWYYQENITAGVFGKKWSWEAWVQLSHCSEP